MVFDRTAEDVELSKKIIDEKIKKRIDLTEDDLYILSRGSMTIETLNRIENKQNELKNFFNSIGYWNVQIKNKHWSHDEIFDISSFKRILENTETLKKSFFTFNSTPKTPTAKYHFSNLNDLEKILYDLEEMVMDVRSNYRECGNFYCGDDL